MKFCWLYIVNVDVMVLLVNKGFWGEIVFLCRCDMVCVLGVMVYFV